jgi:hypothetical protein
VLAEAMERLLAVHDQSRKRLQAGGGEAKPMVTGVAAFEAARRSRNGDAG